MINRVRFITASILSPLIVAAILAAANHFLGFGSMAAVVAISAAFAYVGLIIFGLPAIYMLYRLDRLSWWSLAIVGIVIGCFMAGVFMTLLAVALNSNNPWGNPLLIFGHPTIAGYTFCTGTALGLVAALGFDLISGITLRSNERRYRSAT